MDKFSYIYKTKFIKMGKWDLRVADSETWHTEHTSRYFKRIFGFGKGSFIIQTLDDDLQHAYFPKVYVEKIYKFIHDTTQKDYKKLERILKGFYKLKKKAIVEIPKINPRSLNKLTNKQLLKIYKKNRDWAHRVAPYDQFGWIAEDYWNKPMDKILKKYGLKPGSSKYHEVLFALTKPEEMSTTLLEKKAVLQATLDFKNKKLSIEKIVKKLAKQFGWMPVFTYGTPWDDKYYVSEIKHLAKKTKGYLKSELTKLENYRKVRTGSIRLIQETYTIDDHDLQIFIDFGLTLDARNEAEYLVSRCGFGLIPIYREITKRNYASVSQLRNMHEAEIEALIEGKLDALKILEAKGKIIGWIFDKSMMIRKLLGPEEARKFYNYLNKTAKHTQGDNETHGVCASPGKVRGVARIIHNPSDNSKVKSGDILIAHVTTVDYLPGMKKAIAFVTELGGLTCHAAVVAREFGVPCIVGLKNATVNFKDGDMIEVDADKGIVRKI